MWWIGEADASNAGEGEEVGFIGVDARTDEAGDASGDTPPDGETSIILYEWYGGEKGVAGGGFDEVKKGICDVRR